MMSSDDDVGGRSALPNPLNISGTPFNFNHMSNNHLLNNSSGSFLAGMGDITRDESSLGRAFNNT